MELVGGFFLFLISCEVLSASVVQDQSCGRRQRANSSIVGRTKAKKNEMPWLVAFFKLPHEKFFCGGSLIGSKHVLSGEK